MKRTQVLTELRGSSDDELRGRVKRLEEELFSHRLKKFTNQQPDISLIRKTKREIALAHTLLSARKHGVEAADGAKGSKE